MARKLQLLVQRGYRYNEVVSGIDTLCTGIDGAGTVITNPICLYKGY